VADLLTLTEFGRRCDPPVSRVAVRKAILAGHIQGAVRAGNSYQVPADAVESFNTVRKRSVATESLSMGDLARRNLVARTEKESALAHKARLEAATMAAELLYRDDVEELWAETTMRARAKLLTVPSRLAAVLAGRALPAPEVEAAAMIVVHEALSELAEYDHKRYSETARRRGKRVADADVARAADPAGAEPPPVRRPRRAGDPVVGAAATVHGRGVGRTPPAPVAGGKRGAGAVAERTDAVPGGDHGRDQRPGRRARGGDGGGADRQNGSAPQRHRVSRGQGSGADAADPAHGGDCAGVQQGPGRPDGAGHAVPERKSRRRKEP
jgi:hypothetical protein